MTGDKSIVFKFADVEVREREFRLVKAGEVLPVEPKTFRVLLYLLRNPQKLIAKEELLNAVWGDAAVTDSSLTRTIAQLRRLLGDDIRNPRYIETVATVGYRFLYRVEISEDALGGSGTTDKANGLSEAETVETIAIGQIEEATANSSAKIDSVASIKGPSDWQPGGRHNRLLWWLLPGAPLLAVGLAIAVWYSHRPLPQPRITGYTQITHDGHEKRLAGTDGSRLYFTQMQPKSLNQVGIGGGEVAQIPAAVPGVFYMLDVSPDGSNLLIASLEARNSLWIVRTLGGTSRRIGNGDSATFSPDGNSIAYSTYEGELWRVQSDGTGGHKLASIGGYADDLRWSPDGKIIRFNREGVLWEMSANGSSLHQVLPGWQYQGRECCGSWTPDGKFFVFLTSPTVFRGDQIWALDERRGLFRHPSTEPVQLTSGPISWSQPIPGKGTNKIFSDGKTPRGELCRFDTQTKQLQPFLGGISAQDVSFSKDGQSVAYVSYPDGILWKANRDGSSPLQLSSPSIYAMNPRWSPDGLQILFTDIRTPDSSQIYLVSSEGSSPQRVLPDGELGDDPNWSADGRKVVFNAPGNAQPTENLLRILDLASRKVSVLPGSAGLESPRWSPDGKYIAATSLDFPGLKVLDLATQRWLSLPEGGRVDYPAWSRDSRFIYFLRLINGDRGVYRIRVGGSKTERVADLKDWHITGYFSYWMALDPTDAPLILRDIGTDDIYALTLEEK